ASQVGLPAPVREPAMSYMSLTAAVRPIRGPVPLPVTGAARSWGTKNAPRLSSSRITHPPVIQHVARLNTVFDRFGTLSAAPTVLAGFWIVYVRTLRGNRSAGAGNAAAEPAITPLPFPALSAEPCQSRAQRLGDLQDANTLLELLLCLALQG